MSNFAAFLKPNVPQEENTKYIASKRFKDEKGKPINWEIRPITSEDDENLRRACVMRVQVPGKRNQYTQETDYNKYLGKLAAACTVFPALDNAELQDSYGVKGADTLLKAMLKPGEYTDYISKVQEANGFDASAEELVDEAKN